jgi:hypothetical protein
MLQRSLGREWSTFHCATYAMDFDDASVFTTLFSNTSAEKIHKCTYAQLVIVKDGRHPITDTLELYQFVATMFIRSRFRVSTSMFYVLQYQWLMLLILMSIVWGGCHPVEVGFLWVSSSESVGISIYSNCPSYTYSLAVE